jgi:aryl-alcohol dehydrogenase-like predicted oxidoreductase
MQTRTFGRTGHLSTLAIFGTAAFWEISQKEADRVMEQVIAAGVNHIDVAPSYGQAEQRIGPWMKRERRHFFLGCKTQERARKGAWQELQHSLKKLHSENLDLYQLHNVSSFEDLEAVTAPGGALEALVEAREKGLTRFLGITGHGVQAPQIMLEALRRFDFDSILFPLNFVQASNPEYYQHTLELLRQCRSKNVGVMVIKSIARGPWGEKQKTANTWYEPFREYTEISRAVNFVLSHEVTGICTAGDIHVLPLVLRACEEFTPLSVQEQVGLIEAGRVYQPLFA